MSRNRPALWTIIAVAATAIVLTTLVQARFADAAPPASGGGKGAAKIAVVNPVKVFREMQESKDWATRANTDKARLMAESKQKKDEVTKLEREIQETVKPGTPMHEEKTQQLLKMISDAEAWNAMTSRMLERNEKRQMVVMWTKVQAAITDYAKANGIDVILSSQNPPIPPNPENMPNVKFEMLSNILAEQRVLYSADSADITNEVTALLDAQYKNQAAPKQ